MIVRKTGIIVYNLNKQVIRQSNNSKDFLIKSLSLNTKTSKYVQLYRKTNLCMRWGCINISLKHRSATFFEMRQKFHCDNFAHKKYG